MSQIKQFAGKLFSSILILSLLSSCNTNNLYFSKDIANINDSKFKKITEISGKVEFPQFNTKASINDLLQNTTVNLIYPSDYSDTTKRNIVIGVGLTNSSGVFSIKGSANFKPTNGDIFILEAQKRIGSSGKNVLTLRTYIKWIGTGWESITMGGIFINSKTTAITIISDIEKSLLGSSDTINKIDKDGNILLNIDNTTNNTDFGQFVALSSNKLIKLNDNGTNLRDIVSDIVGIHNIRFSPDSTKIVFEGYDGNNYQLYVVNSDGSVLTNVTNNTDSLSPNYPSWSPDSKKILFTNGGIITVMNFDGTGKYIVTDNLGYVADNPIWTNDGTKIIYVSNYNIKIIDANGTNLRSITNFSNSNNANYSYLRPGLSKDGKKIAFYYKDTDKWSLYTVNTDGTGLKKLLDAVYLYYWGSSLSPKWSPDGTKIAFLYNNANTGSSNASLGVINSDGSNPKFLGFTGYGSTINPTWTNNGLQIFYAISSGIFKTFPDGTNNTRVSDGTDFDWLFSTFNNVKNINSTLVLTVNDLVNQALINEKDPVANIYFTTDKYALK